MTTAVTIIKRAYASIGAHSEIQPVHVSLLDPALDVLKSRLETLRRNDIILEEEVTDGEEARTSLFLGEYASVEEAIVDNEAQLISDPGFDAAATWTLGTGWAVSGSLATKSAGTASDISQIISTDSRINHIVKINISTGFTDNFTCRVQGGIDSGAFTPGVTGIQFKNVVAGGVGGTTRISAVDATSAGVIDSFTVYEIDQTIGSYYWNTSGTPQYEEINFDGSVTALTLPITITVTPPSTLADELNEPVGATLYLPAYIVPDLAPLAQMVTTLSALVNSNNAYAELSQQYRQMMTPNVVPSTLLARGQGGRRRTRNSTFFKGQALENDTRDNSVDSIDGTSSTT